MTSIYQAEIYQPGRYRRLYENQFTSRVFGALAMLPQKTVLLPFLKELAKGTTQGEDENDKAIDEMKNLDYLDIFRQPIELWKPMVGIPDVIINTKKVLIVIEVKKDNEQPLEKYVEELVKQYRGASKKAKDKKQDLAYFLLTKGYKRPAGIIEKAQKELRRTIKDATIHWRRWPQVWKWLAAISEHKDVKADSTVKSLLEATIRLIKDEKMSGSTGFKNGQEGWEEVQKAFTILRERYEDIETTMGEVKSELEEEKIFFEDADPDLTKKCNYLPCSLKYRFRCNEWENPCLEIHFDLVGPDKGVSIGLWWEFDDKEEKDDRIAKIREGKNYSPDKFELSNEEDGIWIDNSPDFEDLETGEGAVTTLVKRTKDLRDFANAIATLREATGYGETRKKRRKL